MLETYRALLAAAPRASGALDGGGIRWLAVGDDAVAFVRESAEESVLVFAARSAAEVALGAEFSDDAQLLEGTADWAGGSVATSGPTFLAWRLPGVETPGW